MPAATATADPPLDPPGDPRSSHGLRVGPKAECSVDEPIANSSQFVLPTITAPAALESLDDGGGVGRDVMFEHPRSGGGLHAGGADVVLQRDGDAEQGRVGRALTVEALGGRQRSLVVNVQEGVEARVQSRDPIEGRAADLDRRRLSRRYGGANLAGALGKAHEPITRGTLNSPAARSAAGAWPSTTSRSSDGAGVSSRIGAGASVAGISTAEVSTCWTWSA